MKKFLMIGLCLLVAGIIGCSKGSQEVEANERSFKKHINSSSEVKSRVAAGIGGDIDLWKEDGFDIVQETRYDLNSGDGTWKKSNLSTFTVVDVKTEEGILQTAWNKLKSLFNK